MGQRRRSVLVSTEQAPDPASEKKVIGKYGRRAGQSGKKINSNLAKNSHIDSKNGPGETEMAAGQTLYKLSHTSLSTHNNSQHRKKKSEKSSNGEVPCISQAINGVGSKIPMYVYSPSLSAMVFAPISASTLTYDGVRMPTASNINSAKSKANVRESVVSQKNELIGSNELNQNTKGNLPHGVIHNNTALENQPYGQVHIPFLTPFPPHFWCNQFIPHGGVSNIVPPPPNHFPHVKPPLIIQKQDIPQPNAASANNFHFNSGSLLNISNNYGEGLPAALNNPIQYYQPYSLRSYEISTLNVINYLIPNKDFRSKISSVVHDLRNWLELSRIPLLVLPYGSTSTGFADQFSDVDIALIPRQDLSDRAKYVDAPISDIFTKPPGLVLQELLNLLQRDSSDSSSVSYNKNPPNRSDRTNSLSDNKKNIKRGGIAEPDLSKKTKGLRNPFTCIQDITSAHIPIIRMLHTHTDIVLDISIALPSIGTSSDKREIEKRNPNSKSLKKILPIQKTNSLSIIQSRLGILTWYARMDPRVVHVVVLTKVWTRFRGLRNTLNGFPGGYAWTICVIFFFQKIGILPVIDANEFFVKSQNASNILFKDMLEYLNSDSVQCQDKLNCDNSAVSLTRGKYREGGKETFLQRRIGKICGDPEESCAKGKFPSLVSEFDQEELINYKDDVEYVSNSNYDTETASGSAGNAEQSSSSDSSFDSEPDKGPVEKGVAGCKMLYLDVVKGSKYQYGTSLEAKDKEPTKQVASIKNSIGKDDIEESLMVVKDLKLEKSIEESEALCGSHRSSTGSTTCTYSLSPGALSSNICNSCTSSKNSCTCTPSNSNASRAGLTTERTSCNNCLDQVEPNNEDYNMYSSINTKNHSKPEKETANEKYTKVSDSIDSIKDIIDIDKLFSSPPTLITNVKTIDESKFLKYSQSHTLFYRFLKFIETHLWTTVIDISSPEIINTTVPGICCDIRNPFPGPPACRPIFDENNKRHLRNEIQRAIQIIQSPFGDFSSICGGHLNVSTEHPKGFSGETEGVGSVMGINSGLPQSSPNINAAKQRNSPRQHSCIGFEASPLHIIGYNTGMNGKDQNNGTILYPGQIPVTNLYGDSSQHLIFPSVPFHVPPPPPPPPPRNNKHLSSTVVGNEKKSI
ncbi:Po1 beta-like nucleotidyltransferase [Cryptosporidium canis]|uniref:Po1 beta-like nucleotidyltransferase n=1 Tax=Cryptosporidium canis TaxID=195482 RepID=A0ABQ8P5R7_9CRYT|nr:Po1 beta-like nucleotidyltransferase [Cryptosporidium canis]